MPFRVVPLAFIDRKNEVPEIPTYSNDEHETVNLELDESNPENWQRMLKGKRKATSPPKKPGKFKCVPPIELARYLRSFVEGHEGEPERRKNDV